MLRSIAVSFCLYGLHRFSCLNKVEIKCMGINKQNPAPEGAELELRPSAALAKQKTPQK
jgi:hypothetical protein